MRVLITGADGQLGRSLQRVLLTNKIEYRSLSRKEMDITNLGVVRKVVEDSGAHAIFNAAAYTNVDQAELEPELAFGVNEIGAHNLAIVARETNSRLIHFSTDYVFSGIRKTPWKVDDSANPISVYGKSKLAGEMAIRDEYPQNSVILRTAWLYSEYGKNFYKTILSLANKNSEPINVVNDQFGQPTSACELSELAISTLNLDFLAGTYHASNSGIASWYDFAFYIFQLAGADTDRVQPISSKEYKTKAPRPEYSVLDNEDWGGNTVKRLEKWQVSVAKAFPAIQDSLG